MYVGSTGYNIVGQTLKTILISFGPDLCGDSCRQEPACKGYDWKLSLFCELKSTYEGLESAAGHYGVVITKEESLEQCAPITDNVDYSGNDARTSLASTASECADQHNRCTPCNAFTWSQFSGGSCYLKTVALAKPVASAPAADGSAYLKSAVCYKCQPLEANTDRPGNDIGSAPSWTAANCCGICQDTLYCVAFSWTEYNGGACWFKEQVSGSTAAAGATSDVAYW